MNTVRITNSLYIFTCLLCSVLATQNVTIRQEQKKHLAGDWKITFAHNAKQQRLYIDKENIVNLCIYDVNLNSSRNFYFEIHVADPELITVAKRIERREFNETSASWKGEINVVAHGIGQTQLYATLNEVGSDKVQSTDVLNVRVMEGNYSEQVFAYTTSAVVLLMFVNLGTVLDLQRIKNILLRPISVSIGFFTSSILLPAVSLLIGYLCLHDKKEQQLALFLTALSPSGGLANICNIFLRGNINLSLAITTINSLLALAMFPLWILLLANFRSEFDNVSLPFVTLAVGSVAIIVALCVGLVLRLLIPKTTKFIFKYLKPLCVFLSLCLIGITVGINAAAFKDITGLMFVATFVLPILAYFISFGVSKVFCRSSTDSLTIAVETSVLGMTIPIVILQYTLEQSRAEQAIIVPMLAALLSLGCVVIFYVIRCLLGYNKKIDDDGYDSRLFILEQQN